MAHTYVSIDRFKKQLVDGGLSSWTDSDARLLLALESASRTVDWYCNRSRWHSGFGPRLGTNVYDGSRSSLRLELRDDLLALTGNVEVLDDTGGTSSELVEETDFYLQPNWGPPYRRLRTHGLTSAAFTVGGLRVASVPGKWGYSDEREPLEATLTVADASSTSATLSADDDEVSAGDTLLAGTEQLYVRGKSSTTLTVERGANGTTAAAHAAAELERYLYHPNVADATLQITQDRYRAGEAGVQGTYGGGEAPIVTPQRMSERQILRATVQQLRLVSLR